MSDLSQNAIPQKCPSCDADITEMDLAAFRNHTRDEHPEMYDLIRRALERIR